jgi:hypothetical protein
VVAVKEKSVDRPREAKSYETDPPDNSAQVTGWPAPVDNHVIAATGYAVDIDRIDFLNESLCMRIETVEKTPGLSSSF